VTTRTGLVVAALAGYAGFVSAGCYQRVAATGDAGNGSSGGSGDGGAPLDTPLLMGSSCFGDPSLFTTCANVTPGVLEIAGTLDTTNCKTPEVAGEILHNTGSNTAAACVFAADSLTLTGVVATGSLPLVLYGTSRLEISGLSASSGSNRVGPGADTDQVACLDSTIAGNGGGAGGSHATLGGPGGQGAGKGGSAQTVTGSGLVTGCNGQPPGVELTQGVLPGGIVYAVSGGMLTGTGVIDANGQGGRGGATSAGAFGGGAGGLVALSAMDYQLGSMEICAIGGGGGGGGTASGPGSAAIDPPNMSVPTAAPGGNGGPGGGGASGGPGASSDNAAGGGGGPGSGTNGGGGGGGGLGHILVLHGSANPEISQPTAEHPTN
jgi:hypothetical protein